jgi:hypothetical protein
MPPVPRDTRPAASGGAAAALLVALSAPALPALAQEPAGDTLAVPAAESTTPAAAERPTRGMRMSQVEARYGAPATRHSAVGSPPITRWDYPGFVVFFEQDFVVHAVTR